MRVAPGHYASVYPLPEAKDLPRFPMGNAGDRVGALTPAQGCRRRTRATAAAGAGARAWEEEW